MIAHVLQAHFDEKDVPFKCRVCGVCKASNDAFHCHHKKNHPKIHPEGLGQALGNKMNMTEQDFILSHFVEVNQDVAEPGTSDEGASAPDASDSPSTGEPSAAGPPEPEADASTLKCSMEQADPSPAQPPTPRDPFNEDPLAAPEDMVDLYAEHQDSDFPESNEELSQQVAKLKSEVAEKAKRVSMLEGTVDKAGLSCGPKRKACQEATR